MPDQSSAATEHAILQEISRPLEELPDDPLAVVNADFPVALRGYDREAVDDYVRRTRQLVAELQATRSPESAVRRALERVGGEITGILQRAHETAEQITAQSRREAEDRLEHAREEAAQIAAAAERRVADLDADTDRIWLERQRIVADAEELAGQLVALARTAAERFPADAAPDNPPGGLADEPSLAGEAEGAEDGGASGYEEPGDAEPGYAEADYAEPDDDEGDHDQAPQTAAPVDDSIDETVPFQPVQTDADPAGEHPAGGEPAGGEPASGPQATPSEDEEPTAEGPVDGGRTGGPSTADDTTAVIPPASQAAANRRPLP